MILPAVAAEADVAVDVEDEVRTSDLSLIFVFVGWRQAARWKIYDLSLSRLAEQVILDSLRIWVRLG